ncbi:MAG: trehalase family glycosidase [Pseudomonadota bacterium]
MTNALIENAKAILRRNDKGSYTVPTHGLYPFQWNWDSALSALGFAHFDERRAWREIETLFAHQWPDGMVPHIIFHEEDKGYFPGPDVWQTGRPTPTSGITQPPVAGFAVRRLFDRVLDRDLAERKARALLPKIHAWHSFFYRDRDPDGTGLVAITHPWESGRDNSIDWDAALDRVPRDGLAQFQRRDTDHADPTHRPTQHQYEGYIALVQAYRDAGWDNRRLHAMAPFKVVDPGFNGILLRSCADLADLADLLGERDIARKSHDFVTKSLAALDDLWSDRHGQYLCHDRQTGAAIESASVGGLIPVFAPIPKARAAAIADRLATLARTAEYLAPSHDPTDPRFDAKRYWRGPAWLIVNYMISDGLAQAGQHAMAARLKLDSLRLIERNGFAEYYDPITSEGCGGGSFTWTAAMVLEFLSAQDQAA